jgi:hypothetical protein
VGQVLRFDGDASDAQGRAFTATWDFGDGATAEGLDATHAYAGVGEFTAELRLTTDGCSVAALRTVITVVDTLLASIVTSQPAYGPLDQVEGSVLVTFQNGEPVPGASLDLGILYGTGLGEADAALLALDVPTASSWSAASGEDGGHAFDAPFLLAAALDPSLPQVLNLPGSYVATVSAAWEGNSAPAAAGYCVGLGDLLPPASEVVPACPTALAGELPEPPAAPSWEELPDPLTATADGAAAELPRVQVARPRGPRP